MISIYDDFFHHYRRPLIMAIVNITADSFSGDGLANQSGNIMAHIEQILRNGADILDIGAESTRPGAQILTESQEQERLLPVLAQIRAKYPHLLLSVDTYKPQTAQLALAAGANIINDIGGLENPLMAKMAQPADGVVIMHNNAKLRQTLGLSYKNDDNHGGDIAYIMEYFTKKIDELLTQGYKREAIIIDPGLGFGKDMVQSLAVVKNLAIFNKLGVKSLIGASRKSFLGRICATSIHERLAGSLAVVGAAFDAQTHIVRVHDIKATKDYITTKMAIANDYNNVCYIALGSNLGNKEENLVKAKNAMRQFGTIGRESSVHITSNPYLANQPLFANMVLELTTNCDYDELLTQCKNIERAMGRDFAAERNSARIIDCDIITFNDLVIKSDYLTIPHALAQTRDFVLKPMAEIAPHYRFRDTGFAVSELLLGL